MADNSLSARDEQEIRQAAKDAAKAVSQYEDEAGEQIAENAVYLEDIEGRPGPSRFRTDSTPTTSRSKPSAEEEAPIRLSCDVANLENMTPIASRMLRFPPYRLRKSRMRD